MKKTILLGTTGTKSYVVSKYIFFFIGLLYLILSIQMFYEDGLSFISGGWLLTGLFFIIYTILFFTTTPITPRVDIDVDSISYRKSPFGKTYILKWSDIKSIDFAAYQITFNLAENEHSFSYKVHSATSIEIKSSIREVADRLGIEVSGG